MTVQVAEAEAPAQVADEAPKLPELGPDEGGWTFIIRPQRHLLDLHLAEVWRYRDLIMLFVWRDFVAAYKQYILGPAWHFIQPLTATIISTVVFNKIARLPTDQVPPCVPAGISPVRGLRARSWSWRSAVPDTASYARAERPSPGGATITLTGKVVESMHDQRFVRTPHGAAGR